VNAINWAGSGKGLGVVSFLDGEFEGSFWWTHQDSFLRDELEGKVDYAGSEQNPIISPCQGLHPLNAGLTPVGLSNWTNSFHATFLPIQGYESIIDSSLRPGTAVAIAKSDAWADPWTGLYWLGDEEDHECFITANYRGINTLQPGDAGAPSSGAR
jgi:hypothetical protein